MTTQDRAFILVCVGILTSAQFLIWFVHSSRVTGLDLYLWFATAQMVGLIWLAVTARKLAKTSGHPEVSQKEKEDERG